MFLILENGDGDLSSNRGRDCISHRANTSKKCMNPIIFRQPIGK